MPTFGNIDGEESATVTFTVAAVSLTRNSSAELQEILCVGDPDVASSLGVARVTASAPPSTNAALNVRIVSGASTVADAAFRAVLPSTATDNPFQLAAIASGYVSSAVPAAGSSGLISWLAGGNVSSLSTGHVTVDTGSVTVHQGNTNFSVQVSTGAISVSTGSVTVHGNQSSNSSVYLPVRITNGTAFAPLATDLTHGSTVSTVAANLTAPGVMLRTGSHALSNTNLFNLLRGSTEGAAFVTLLTDSGVSVMDSTAGALKVNVVAGSAAGDTTVTASFAAGYVSSAVPAAGSSGLISWLAGGNVSSLSTGHVTVDTGSVTIHQGNTNFSVQVSTGALSVSTGSVTIHQGNTNFSVQVSTGALSVSTGSVTVHQGNTNFTVQSRITTSSGGAVEGSTNTPAQSVMGLHVRVTPSSVQSTGASTVGATSTNTTLISSAAATEYKVFAFSVTSTVITPSTVSFRSSAGSVLWPMVIGTGSSGISGMTMGGVPPPAFLFKTASANALTFHTPSSGPEFHVSVSYFV